MRIIDADRAIDMIDAWLDSVGIVLVAKPLSGYEELIGCIEDTPTFTLPNEWVSVEERLPEPGERVLAAKGTFVGEAYLASNGAWMRHDGFPWEVDAWMPLPAPPGKGNNVPTNEPLTIEELREMDGEPVWVKCLKPNKYINPPVRWRILEKSIAGTFGVWDGEDSLIERNYGTDWLAYRCPPEGEEDT